MNKVERQLNLVFLLLNSTRGLTRNQIKMSVAEYQQCASDSAFERMFERDKQEIKSMGFNISIYQDEYASSDEMYYSIKPSLSFFDLSSFTVIERLLLQIARISINASTAYPQKLVLKLENSFYSNLVYIKDDSLNTNSQVLIVMDALLERRKVKFAYNKVGYLDYEMRNLTPLSLVIRMGLIFIIGFDHSRSDYRVFRSDRITGEVVKLEVDSVHYTLQKQEEFYSFLDSKSREIEIRIFPKDGTSLSPASSYGFHSMQDSESLVVFCSEDDIAQLFTYLSENLRQINLVEPVEFFDKFKGFLAGERYV